MKKFAAFITMISLCVLAIAGSASAQDPVRGTVSSDPPTVPEAGEHTLTASGEGYTPDTDILLTACTSPADELVFGASTEEIVAAGEAIAEDILGNCDIANATAISVDSDGNFSETITVEVGPNFFLSAGAVDGSQTGATWVPIVDPAVLESLAVTGVDSGDIALIGGALLLFGFALAGVSRRYT